MKTLARSPRQTPESRTAWYEDSVFNVHFDYHATGEDQEFGAQLSEQHLLRELGKYRPTMVQFPAKGGPGYATYPTKIGIPIPGLKKDCLKIWRAATRKLGIKLVIYYNALDYAQEAKHPDWVRIINDQGQRADAPDEKKQNQAGPFYMKRKIPHVMFCCNSSYQDEIMLPMVREIIENYDPDGFWFDAEVYCVTPCYCEQCRNDFKKTCHRNPPPTDLAHPDWPLWQEYHRNLFERYLVKSGDFIHALNPQCCYVSNYAYSLSQPEMPPAGIDWLSGDIGQFGGISLTARVCEAKRKPFDVMTCIRASAKPFELRAAPGYHKSLEQLLQDGLSALINGGRWIAWDNPTKTGSIQPGNQDRLAQASVFINDRKEWFRHTQPLPWTAVLYSVESHYRSRFISELYPEAEPWYVYHPYREDYRAIRGLHKIFVEGHKDFGLLNEATIDALDPYGVIVLPHQTSLSRKVVDKIARFIRNGGGALAVGHLPKALWEVFGLASVNELPKPLYHNYTAPPAALALPGLALGVAKGARTKYDLVDSTNETRAKKTGHPLVVLNRWGKGKTACFAFDAFGEYQEVDYYPVRDLVLEMFNEVDPQKWLETDAPSSVEITLRTKGKNILIHLANMTFSRNPYGNTVLVDQVPVLHHIALRFYSPEPPAAVYSQPDHEPVAFTYADRHVNLVVESLHLHRVIEIVY